MDSIVTVWRLRSASTVFLRISVTLTSLYWLGVFLELPYFKILFKRSHRWKSPRKAHCRTVWRQAEKYLYLLKIVIFHIKNLHCQHVIRGTGESSLHCHAVSMPFHCALNTVDVVLSFKDFLKQNTHLVHIKWVGHFSYLVLNYVVLQKCLACGSWLNALWEAYRNSLKGISSFIWELFYVEYSAWKYNIIIVQYLSFF